MTMPNSQLVMFSGNNVETVEEVRSMQLAVRCDALKSKFIVGKKRARIIGALAGRAN
ncbi:hypothetical protein [Vibrio sp. SG41-7]|uniref:hypothetical protein n=1 Tax=Vibrio sp. SG41-7 TaxID=2760973 RepID=UPI002175DA4B|nr:hypothetical protein [Vibrio sp. SG41-7]